MIAAPLSGTAAAADAQSGKALSLTWCSACHLVSNDQAQASDAQAPSFYKIAQAPGLTEDQLIAFLADPHPKMPGMPLSNTEIGDITRYISTLKP
ncbi:cytochrome C552 [Labrenzia suaedae]|uniref:Cytochrome C552 n=2 Tax=Roseibium litorale TaxID=2803841 RepID=A0ABR9CMJ7_9HYPH|nr:cytochrome C552 [Roseibium litorale]